MICIHNKILCRHKNKVNPVICNNMNELEGHMLSEISPEQKDKYCISVMCEIYKKKSRSHISRG